jgi:hypothetical protein
MSLDKCQTCRFVGYCTFPRNRVITECDEYEEMDTAPAYDWDLQQLLRLWAVQEDVAESS